MLSLNRSYSMTCLEKELLRKEREIFVARRCAQESLKMKKNKDAQAGGKKEQNRFYAGGARDDLVTPRKEAADLKARKGEGKKGTKVKM